jgi:hypothetical protein
MNENSSIGTRVAGADPAALGVSVFSNGAGVADSAAHAQIFPPADTSDETLLDEVHLLGQLTLEKYLRFMKTKVIGGDGFDKPSLVREWTEASLHFQKLEETEAGLADRIDVHEMDRSLAPLIDEVKADPIYRYTFDTFPTEMMMVELDKLTLYQTHVTRQFTDRIQARLGPRPEPEALFRFCQPPSAAEAPARVRKVGTGRYVFTSESMDFRRHEPVLLRPDQVSGYETFGPVAGIVGLVVGYGSNFLTAIRHGKNGRVLLHNGYHRAYAMRALGITHAPIIVRTVENQDELSVAAVARVTENPDFYFTAARPPMMKDFFDPHFCRSYRIRKVLKMIEVEFEIREFSVEA